MCMIFDRFPNHLKAEVFADFVRMKYKLSANVYDNQEQSNAVDPFPFKLNAPIVLIERTDDDKIERQVENLVIAFDGVFAGT
jgi:hypothetical protein